MKRSISCSLVVIIALAAMTCSKKSSPTSPVNPKTWQFEMVGKWNGPSGIATRTPAIALSGNYVYLGDEHGTIHVINVTNPASPTESGIWTSTIGQPIVRLLIDGQSLYAAQLPYGDDTSRTYILSIAAPTALLLQSTIKMQGNTGFLQPDRWPDGGPSAVTHDSARTILAVGYYVTGPNYTGAACGLYDVTTASAPQLLWVIPDIQSPRISGNYLYGLHCYLSNGQNVTLQVFDISNPQNPQQVGTELPLPILHYVGTTGTANGAMLCMQGDHLYMSGNYLGYLHDTMLTVISVGSPTNPSSQGSFRISDYGAMDMTSNDSILYVGGAGLCAVNIKSPAQPDTLVSVQDIGNDYLGTRSIAIRDNLVYLGGLVSVSTKGLLIVRLVNK